MKNFDLLISQALRILFIESRFFYFVLAQVPKVITKDLPAPGGVGYDRGSDTVKLYLNPDYLEHMTPGVLATLLEHEACHLAFSHMFHLKNPPKGISPKTLNQAQDYVINDNIPSLYNNYDKLMKQSEESQTKVKALVELFQAETDEERKKEIYSEIRTIEKKNFLANGCLAPRLAHIEELKGKQLRDMSSLEVARILSEKDPENEAKTYDKHAGESGSGEKQEGSGQSQSGKQQSQDQSQGDGELGEIPQHMIDRIMQEADAENKMSGQPGSVPGAVEQRLDALRKSKMSFRSQLKLFAQKSVGTKMRRSWSRQNRKYPGQTPGSSPDKDSRLVVWIDTSGSVWDAEVQAEIAGHIKALSMVCTNLDVVFGDVTLTHKVTFKGSFSLNKLVFKGGGGTNCQFVFDYAKKTKADGVFLITDGEVGSFNQLGVPTIVGLVTKHAQEIKGCKNIRMRSA